MQSWSPTSVRVGISGWTYAPWRRIFYPPGLPHDRELAYAAHQMNSIEINGSFYSLQQPSSYQRWYDETPPGFVFSVKGPRFITHMKKLAGVDAPLANFFASGVLALADKLGPLLWQLPPTLGYDAGRLAAFFERLPRTTADAAALAARHDHRMDGRALLRCPVDAPLRHALEIRHPSFETRGFIDVLRKHEIALVCADTAGKWPMLDDVTANFVYVRLHGADQLYVSGYSDAALARWAGKVRCWSGGHTPSDGRTLAPAARRTQRDVYIYFDNDAKVRAPYDAVALAARLGIHPLGPPPLPPSARATRATPRSARARRTPAASRTPSPN